MIEPTAVEIADMALNELLRRSQVLAEPERGLERDTVAKLPPMRLGDGKVAPHAFVLVPSAPRGVAVRLDMIQDVSMEVHRPSFYDLETVEEFRHAYIAPAMEALGQVISRKAHEKAIGHRDAEGRALVAPLVFASAPLEVDPQERSAVASRDGVSLRATLRFDIGRMATVLSLDILYGLRVLGGDRP